MSWEAMPMPKRPELRGREIFESRTEVWREAGLEREIERRQAHRARWQALVSLPLLVGVVVAYNHRHALFPGAGSVVRILAVVALLIVGWAFARSAGRALGPSLFRRMDPGTAGTVGFLVRLLAIAAALLVALRIAGLSTSSLALGGAGAGGGVGVAAQQAPGKLVARAGPLSAPPVPLGGPVRRH